MDNFGFLFSKVLYLVMIMLATSSIHSVCSVRFKGKLGGGGMSMF